jgi:L-malate glycosyltransferase
MRILIFTEIYDSGGIDTFIINLINNWPETNDEFILISNEDYPGLINIKNRVSKSVSFQGYKNKDFLSKTQYSLTYKLLSLLLSPFYFINYVLYFYAYFNKYSYETMLVVNGGYPGGIKCIAASIASKLSNFNAKNIHNVHNLAQKKQLHSFIQEYFLDLMLTLAVDDFVTVSNAAAKSFNSSSRLFNSNISFIYNGISEEKLSEQYDHNLLKNLKISNDDRLCLMLATFEKRKGHEFLLRSFVEVIAKIPSAKLLMSGFGLPYEKEYVESLVKELNLSNNVAISDFQSDIDTLIRRASFLVLPSQSYESFGYVLVEAMLRKKPTIGTNIGGIPEVIVNNSTGYIVQKNHISLMAERIITLLTNKELSIKFGENGYRVFINKFTAKKMSSSYYKLINNQ